MVSHCPPWSWLLLLWDGSKLVAKMPELDKRKWIKTTCYWRLTANASRNPSCPIPGYRSGHVWCVFMTKCSPPSTLSPECWSHGCRNSGAHLPDASSRSDALAARTSWDARRNCSSWMQLEWQSNWFSQWVEGEMIITRDIMAQWPDHLLILWNGVTDMIGLLWAYFGNEDLSSAPKRWCC